MSYIWLPCRKTHIMYCHPRLISETKTKISEVRRKRFLMLSIGLYTLLYIELVYFRIVQYGNSYMTTWNEISNVPDYNVYLIIVIYWRYI